MFEHQITSIVIERCEFHWEKLSENIRLSRQTNLFFCVSNNNNVNLKPQSGDVSEVIKIF